MMGDLYVDPDQTVQVRGITFPVDCIRAAMIETGGLVVGNKDLNAVLDRAMYEYISTRGKIPDSFILESEPGVEFIPMKVNLHNTITGTTTRANTFLYFARNKLFHA